MRNGLIGVILAAMVASGQQKNDLVGTWKLVSNWNVRPNGDRVAPYGENPVGYLIYTADGHMSVTFSNRDRKPLAGDRFSATAAERADAFSTAYAYAGRYSFDGKKVTHHVEVATFQNYVGTDQVREAKIQGNRLTMHATLRMCGEDRASELVWERVK